MHKYSKGGFMVLLIGLAYILNGIVTILFPPRKINIYYGYRSKFARKNQEIWDYANKKFIKVSIKYGTILVVLEAIFISLFKTSLFDFGERIIANIYIAAIMIIVPMIYMEVDLRRRFKE